VKYKDPSFSVFMMANRKEPHCYNKDCKSKVLYQKGDLYYCKEHMPGSGIDTYRESSKLWGSKLGDMGKI
jgi:hypothetical protein